MCAFFEISTLISLPLLILFLCYVLQRSRIFIILDKLEAMILRGLFNYEIAIADTLENPKTRQEYNGLLFPDRMVQILSKWAPFDIYREYVFCGYLSWSVWKWEHIWKISIIIYCKLILTCIPWECCRKLQKQVSERRLLGFSKFLRTKTFNLRDDGLRISWLEWLFEDQQFSPFQEFINICPGAFHLFLRRVPLNTSLDFLKF